MVAYFQGDYTKAKGYFEESLQIERETHNLGLIATLLVSLAWAEGQLGNCQMAMAHYLESLRLHQEIGGKEGIAYALEGMACCYVSGQLEENDPHLATRLLGAAETLRIKIGMPLSQVENADNQANINMVHTQLGEEAFQQAWQEGQAAHIDEVVQGILREYTPE
jgi:tetratricopeptide (TPR) repeat protein